MINQNTVWEVEGGEKSPPDTGGFSFLPEHVGNPVDPFDLEPGLAEAIFGKPLLDELSKADKLPTGHFEIVSVEAKEPLSMNPEINKAEAAPIHQMRPGSSPALFRLVEELDRELIVPEPDRFYVYEIACKPEEEATRELTKVIGNLIKLGHVG